MSVAVCLVLYGFTVAVFGPRLLARLTRAGVTPRLGVAVWLITIGSVVLSWVTAAGFLAVELVNDWNRPGHLLSACFAALRDVALGRYGFPVQLGLLGLTIGAAAALVVLAGKLARALLSARTHTHQHARMARIVGHRVPGQDVLVLDAPERLAYCVAGRPHAIVVTSAALDALGERQLDAVLSHERAHLAGRHHLLVAVTRGLAVILPRIELFTTGARQVAQLLEMCADDVAVRSHGARTVLEALLALSSPGRLPAGALGATGVGVPARVERLAAPPGAVRRWRSRLLLTAVAALLLAGPVLTGLFTTAGLALCGSVMG
ncbi:M56 family metallopeptidase [Prauserella muralis]|uniref:Peptidase M48 domain-containing protein n=1 Tax=Prauserella muralis TaxID=588067 RepID=A0A2V4B899_9PSEU|nr:M56 family metallopeptidase [Prauserella muralis]PXY25385.1 hypothetical protein BAY60_18585 [Prauserella muralis]TWE27499.1 peptidase M48-like protein [Prauserella muralis]